MALYASSPPAPIPLLAQLSESLAILRWLLVLLIVVVGLIVIALWLRRRLAVADEEEGPIGFTLGDLRQMHREGKLSDEEFNTARAAMIARSRAVLNEPPRREAEAVELGPNLLDEAEGETGEEPDESTDNPEDLEDPDNRGPDSDAEPSR